MNCKECGEKLDDFDKNGICYYCTKKQLPTNPVGEINILRTDIKGSKHSEREVQTGQDSGGNNWKRSRPVGKLACRQKVDGLSIVGIGDDQAMTIQQYPWSDWGN